MANCTISLVDSYRVVMTTSPIAQTSTDKSKNQTRVKYSLVMHKGSGSGKWAQGPHYWSCKVDTGSWSGSIGSYDFRNYSTLTLKSGTRTVKHASNGKKTASFSASYTDGDDVG